MSNLQSIDALLSVPLVSLLEIWGELLEAYHGVNGYGGDTAEIYAYCLQAYSPLAHGSDLKNAGVVCNEKQSLEEKAAIALAAIVLFFCESYQCEARIDNSYIGVWKDYMLRHDVSFDHRAHVKIIRKEDA